MSIPDPRRDDACRYAKMLAPRHKTLASLALAVNEGKGTDYDANKLRNAFQRYRSDHPEQPRLGDILGKEAVSDFGDEETLPGVVAPALHEPVNVTVNVGDGFVGDIAGRVREAVNAALPPAISITAPSSSIAELQSCLQWGTSIERQAVEAFAQYGTMAEAAESMGMTVRLFRGLLGELQRKAASHGWAPGHTMTKTVPDGFHVKGVSTYYDAEGNLKGQWVKSNKDQESRLESMMEAIQVIAEPYRGAADPTNAPTVEDDDLLAVIPFGDPHFGMYAWAAESGEDFDLKIAEADLCAAVDHLVALAPPAKQALIISLGDLVHADSASGTTTAGTRVDVDTRQSKVIGVVIRAMQRCIDRGLEKFHHVTFVPVCGNHDDYTSLMLGHCLAAYYAREPRVTIDTSPDRFRWYRFGSNLIGMTHGHTVKKEQLAGIMACDRKADWAETETRVWYTGHIHHETVKEFPGVVVESFRTLAPKDAWHHGSGYRAGRDLRLDIFHREHGRINRHIVGVRQVRAKRAAV